MTRKSPISGETAFPSGERGSFRFRREERLKRRNEIRDVFSRGRRYGCPGAKLFVLRNGLLRNRICFTFSRGFGNAVERNRARRKSREAYRHLRPRLDSGFDLILLMYPDPPMPAGLEPLAFLFCKAGLLR